MLIDQHRIAIWIGDDKTCWTGGRFICLGGEGQSCGLELPLQLADICKWLDILRVLIPARVEGQDILLKHPLKETDDVIAVFQDKPVLRDVAAERLETELLVKFFRSPDILDCETDRECAELHGRLFICWWSQVLIDRVMLQQCYPAERHAPRQAESSLV